MADMDKCACGHWKTQGYPHCHYCAKAKARAHITPEGRAKSIQALRDALKPGKERKFPGSYYTKVGDMRAAGLSFRAIADLLGIGERDVKSIMDTVRRRKRKAAS